MERKCLVVYYAIFNGATGVGNILGNFDRNDISVDDIRKIEKEIIQEVGCNKAVVVNIIPLEGLAP